MSSPTGTVFLQIGEPKTGTTFIQQTLWHNRSLLADRGLLLPGATPHDHFRATQDLLGMRRVDGDPAPAWEGAWEALAAQAAAAPGTAVISHELICLADERGIARAVAPFTGAELHVVLSVRDMVSLVPAEWQETVKHRSTVPWTEWVSSVIDVESVDPDRRRFGFWQAHDTAALLELWSRHVDPSRIHVLTLPPPSAPRSLLWDRFAELVGVDGSGIDLAGARGNASLGIAEAELLRRMNERLGADVPDWFYMHAVKEPLAHGVLGQRPQSGRLRLPPERSAWARAYGADLADRIATGPWSVVGAPAELVGAESDGPGLGPEDADPEQVLDAAVAALAGAIERQYRTRSRPVDLRLALARATVRRIPPLRCLADRVLGVRPAVTRRLGVVARPER
ncbi:hypothetical protein [Amnibacterium sp.]|uniref:hypothetical protein n=1 Tax=Amnibacterium sp. TaxID=1872496 RepID=UPI003F7B547E